MNNGKDIVQEALDYDLAIELIARLRSEAIKRKHAATSDEERLQADAEIQAYNADENILNGYGTDEDRMAVYAKLLRSSSPMPRKILFLDFDGVMVTDRHLEQLTATSSPLRDSYGAVFDPACVEQLKRIIDFTDADIVVTSTWKMELGQDVIRQMWNDRHLPGTIAGVTPDIDSIHRGEEIEAWLSACGQQYQYAIIDDCPFTDFFQEEQLPHLFRVNERIGLDEHTAKLVMEYLK